MDDIETEVLEAEDALPILKIGEKVQRNEALMELEDIWKALTNEGSESRRMLANCEDVYSHGITILSLSGALEASFLIKVAEVIFGPEKFRYQFRNLSTHEVKLF